ncbi:MAG TPA: protein kinase [Kofleriaceae bacterium]|jgi:pyruvate/2-oxoglutarate dehydrogenase complex dihydrolipoamide acyltransferase (E2) component
MTKIDRTVIDSRRPEGGGEDTTVQKLQLGPGLRIEHYELIRELGRGGMGQVFLARDNRLGRRVAIKFLLGGKSKKFLERFLVEAQATARFQHEHIVTIYGVDEYLGLPYMVLEYVEGTTLAQLADGKRLPAGRAIELIVPVVKALARAHAEAIVHRDLKPDNIVVTATGTVKVLDFGVAKLYGERAATEPGTSFVGTLPYMSPEQLGTDEVDHRSDLWAVGIILYQLLAGKHPLDPVTQGRLLGAAAALDEPMPALADDAPGLPDRLLQAVARCLAKTKAERYASADALLADLEPLLPMRAGRNLVADESPYPGLHAFQEADANRFFGRAQDVTAMVARLRDHPLVAVVGPSGVGKSSFVRAGVVPALKAAGEPWEVLIVRPGRAPLAALAGALEGLRDTRDSDPLVDAGDPVARLRAEPGTFGARLRARARRKRTQILLFVDQHEELYTLVPDPAERLAFTACLAGAGDDPSGPLRVLVSMRSDFLDRAAEDRAFVAELTRGLAFLQPLGRTGLEQALVQPLETLGFGFEPGVVHAMLDTLQATPGALPLLQFTASRLWDQRDRQRRVLTGEAYVAMGGVAGALATHADEVLAAFPAPDQKLVRAIFQRLVTPERTRAVVETAELRELSPDVDRIVGRLVEERLLVVQTRGEAEGSVELVHESLIGSWPTLQRWLDENHDDAAYLAQIRAAAKQWDQKGRAAGLLWRGEAMTEARLWRARYHGELPPREREFLDAVFALATRASRIRRGIVIGTLAFLGAVIVAGGVALVHIRNAEQQALEEKATAQTSQREAEQRKREAEQAQHEADKARLAAESARTLADRNAAAAEANLAKYESEHSERTVAQKQAKAAQKTADTERKLLDKQRQDAQRKQDEKLGKITTELK